jgi:hypothetical protein
MTNRPDLIEQLSKLTPTEGEWISEWGLIHIDGSSLTLFINDDSSDDDDKLITLAPTMRIEILDMAKEIEELREDLRRSNIREKSFSDFRREVLEIDNSRISIIDDKYFPF